MDELPACSLGISPPLRVKFDFVANIDTSFCAFVPDFLGPRPSLSTNRASCRELSHEAAT